MADRIRRSEEEERDTHKQEAATQGVELVEYGPVAYRDDGEVHGWPLDHLEIVGYPKFGTGMRLDIRIEGILVAPLLELEALEGLVDLLHHLQDTHPHNQPLGLPFVM